MNLTRTLEDYFQGEKQLGVGLTVFGVVALAAAYWVRRTQTGSFATGLFSPLVLAGSTFGIGGTVLAVRSHSRAVEFVAKLEMEPGKLIAAETIRMEKVNANWSLLKISWGVVILIALAFLLVVRKEWASALGLSLLLLATTLLFVDVFAERRAAVYTAVLMSSSAPL